MAHFYHCTQFGFGNRLYSGETFSLKATFQATQIPHIVLWTNGIVLHERLGGCVGHTSHCYLFVRVVDVCVCWDFGNCMTLQCYATAIV